MVCSKKSWAYVFIGFGGTFLVIGIVCGFVIPKIVIGIVEDKSCVDSQEDSDFEDWVRLYIYQYLRIIITVHFVKHLYFNNYK